MQAGLHITNVLYKMTQKKRTIGTKMDMRLMEQFNRINKENLAKHKFYAERNMHMANIINRQKNETFQSEYGRLEAARLKGPLGVEANNRLEKLKTILINK